VGRLTVLLLAIAGCALEDARPPLARIDISPQAIIENDGFQTLVTLDGTSSADPLDDPAGEAPLTYMWQVLDDESRFEDSRPTSPAPTIRLRGDRPATIVLTVTDRDGLEAVATGHVQLTVR
jgi:hypothetical protein